MTATDTEAALLAAIREFPGEDAPRLVYADWLEENARTAACEACKGCGKIGIGNNGNPYMTTCDECHGTGRVSDGRAELAEFVRVQVELAEIPEFLRLEDFSMQVIKERDAVVGRLERNTRIEEKMRQAYPEARKRLVSAEERQTLLRRRERELWPAVRKRFEGYGVEPCYQTGLMVHQPPDGEIVQRSTVLIQRGLPSVVRCTLAEWVGEPCSQCSGCGHRTLYGDGSGPWAKCQYCVDGRTPGIGPRLAQAWPLVRVETEKQPMHNGREFLWLKREDRPGIASPGSAALPASVFDLLKGYRKYIRDGQAKCYPTESSARAALSDAAIAWARESPS